MRHNVVAKEKEMSCQLEPCQYATSLMRKYKIIGMGEFNIQDLATNALSYWQKYFK